METMTFWHWLTTSRYTRMLEEENALLKEQVKRLLSPGVRHALYGDEKPITAGEVIKSKQEARQSVRTARTGWPSARRELERDAKQEKFEKSVTVNLEAMQ